MTDLEQHTQENSGLHLSRRRIVQGAAWSVPAITIATAAPAFAASAPILTATYNAASFRTTSAANLASGTPAYSGGAQQAAILVGLAVTNGSVASVTLNITTAGNGVTYNNNPAQRSGQTWLASNASVTADGWVITPALTSTTAATSFTATKASSTTSAQFHIVIDQIGAADFPIDFKFSAPGTTSTSTVRVVGSTTVSPYISGSTL